jgi:hypothetical protein
MFNIYLNVRICNWALGLGNAKGACQLLGQKKDICKKMESIGEFDMQCTISFFPFKWCHQNVIRLE